ncbi:Deleted in lung and esophageal cancer protein 1, partial [Rhizophlyctis rosea]
MATEIPISPNRPDNLPQLPSKPASSLSTTHSLPSLHIPTRLSRQIKHKSASSIAATPDTSTSSRTHQIEELKRFRGDVTNTRKTPRSQSGKGKPTSARRSARPKSSRTRELSISAQEVEGLIVSPSNQKISALLGGSLADVVDVLRVVDLGGGADAKQSPLAVLHNMLSPNAEDEEFITEEQNSMLETQEDRLSRLRALKDAIDDAQDRASEEDGMRYEDALRQYGNHFKNVGLPPIRTLMDINMEDLRHNGLVSCPRPEDLSTTEEDQTQWKSEMAHQQWDPALEPRIPKYRGYRTNNGFNPLWYTRNAKVVNVLKPGILEIESTTLPAPPGALEPAHKAVLSPINSMRPFTEDEMKIINRIKSRITYLHNPRFPISQPTPSPPNPKSAPLRTYTAETRWSLITTTPQSLFPAPPTPHHPTQTGIIAIPATVLFTSYTPHTTYSKLLTIKNATANSHRFRLTIEPPYVYSSYFSVSLSHSPLPNDGLVAPGMSCTYQITFLPDSLADYEQTFVVSTESGESFKVPVVAKREPPLLTIPEVLHCGPCRAGFVTVRTWDFVNKGGEGRFM